MWPNLQFHEDLATYTEEILNGKLHFCAVIFVKLEQIQITIKAFYVDLKQVFANRVQCILVYLKTEN